MNFIWIILEETPWTVMHQKKLSLKLYTLLLTFIDFFAYFGGFGYVCRYSPISKHRLCPHFFAFCFVKYWIFPERCCPTLRSQIKERFEDSAPASSDTKSACSCPGNASLNGVCWWILDLCPEFLGISVYFWITIYPGGFIRKESKVAAEWITWNEQLLRKKWNLEIIELK